MKRVVPDVEADEGAKEILSGMSFPSASAVLVVPSKNARGSWDFLRRSSRSRGTWACSWALQSASNSVVAAMASAKPTSTTDSRRSGRLCKPRRRRAEEKW